MKKNVYTHQFTGVVYVVLKTIEDALETVDKRIGKLEKKAKSGGIEME